MKDDLPASDGEQRRRLSGPWKFFRGGRESFGPSANWVRGRRGNGVRCGSVDGRSARADGRRDPWNSCGRRNVADWIGWVATVVFAISYFCRRAEMLRLVQAGAASLWLGYGILLEAPPVIVSNLVVIGLAIGSTWRERRRMRADSCAGEGSSPQ